MKICTKCRLEKEDIKFGPIYRTLVDGTRKKYRRQQCNECRVIYQLKWEAKHPDQKILNSKKYKLKSNYNLSIEQYVDQLEYQKNKCAICLVDLRSLSPQTVHVDHDHSTGVCRGILCGKCNTGLGMFKEDKSLFMRAIEYLEIGAWSRSKLAEKGDRSKQLVGIH